MTPKWQEKVAAGLVVAVGWFVAFAVLKPAALADGDAWVAPTRAARKANPIPEDEKSVALGAKLYARECLSCHGAKGKGDGSAAGTLEKKPGDLSSPKLAEQSDGALYWKITEGRKPMPTFEKLLTDEERWHVVNFIRTLAKTGAKAGENSVVAK